MDLRNRKEFLFIFPIILCPLIIFGVPLLQGRVLYWGTPALQFIPWRGMGWELLKSGIMPLWNPYNGMGAPLLANYQLAFFYPPGWVLFIFYELGSYPWLAWGYTLLTALHLIWMGLGVYRVMRMIGCQNFGSLVSAIVFSLSSFFVSRAGFFSIIWTGAWLPWIILYSTRLCFQIPDKGKHWRIPVKLTVCISLMLLAGHAQLSWYGLLLAFGWICFWAFTRQEIRVSIKCIFYFATSCFISVLITAIQLFPTLEYLLQSQRASSVGIDQALSYSLWPWHFITLLAPNFFGNPGMGNYRGYGNYWEDSVYFGLIPFILAISTIRLTVANKTKQTVNRKLLVFLWGAIFLSILLALGKFTPVFPFLFAYIPTFNMFNSPVRFLVIADLCFSIMAGLGFESITRPTGKSLYWLRLFTAGAFAIIGGALISVQFLQMVEITFINATILAGLWLLILGGLILLKPDSQEFTKDVIWKSVFTVIVAAEIITSLQGANPFVGMDFYHSNPEGTNRIAVMTDKGRLFISPEDEYQIKFNRFLRFKDFRPIEPEGNIRRVMIPNLNLLDEIYSANNFDPLVPARFSNWMNAFVEIPEDQIFTWLKRMNVSVYETYDPERPEGVHFSQIEDGTRLRWTDCAIIVKNEIEGLNATIDQLSKSESVIFPAVIESDELSAEKCGNGRGAATIIRETPLEIEIIVEGDSTGWMVLSDTWYPGWKAYIDYQPTRILHGDYLFRAIQVPQGKHTIVFRYQPISFWAGCAISILAILIILWLVIKKHGEDVIF